MTTLARTHRGLDWNGFWSSARGRRWRSRSASLFPQIVEMFDGCERVHEFGFGTLEFARLLGPYRWRGIDSSRRAVDDARSQGYDACESACGAGAPDFELGDGICAFQVLSYLSESERRDFLDEARWADVVVLTDMVLRHPPFRSVERFRAYLERWREFEATAHQVGRRTLMLAVSR